MYSFLKSKFYFFLRNYIDPDFFIALALMICFSRFSIKKKKVSAFILFWSSKLKLYIFTYFYIDCLSASVFFFPTIFLYFRKLALMIYFPRFPIKQKQQMKNQVVCAFSLNLSLKKQLIFFVFYILIQAPNN